MQYSILLSMVFLYQAKAFLFPKIKTVSKLELNKYAGRWYEVFSSLIQRKTFQKNLFCTTATYVINPDQSITVINSGNIGSTTGTVLKITGSAKIPDSTQPGRLNVKFPVGPQSDSANYLVVKLGPATFGKTGQYEYTVITSPFKLLTWVLVRDVQEFGAKYETEVLAYLKENGYNWFWNLPRETYQGKDCLYLK